MRNASDCSLLTNPAQVTWKQSAAKANLARNFPYYHRGSPKRLRCTCGAFNISTIILKLIKVTCWTCKKFYYLKNIHIFCVRAKNARGTHRKGRKNFENQPVARTGGLYKIHVVLCSKLADVRAKEVNKVDTWKCVIFNVILQCPSGSCSQNSFYRLTMSNRGWPCVMRVDSACLISGLPHGTRLGSLLVHQSVQFVLAETAPVTSRTAFVLRIPSDIHTTKCCALSSECCRALSRHTQDKINCLFCQADLKPNCKRCGQTRSISFY